MHTQLFPTIYIPHGGGPCFFMEWTRGPADTWDRMKHWLQNLHKSLPRQPEAIVIFSAHWEEDLIKINAQPHPPLYFDYYGFPPHTYELTYPAPGSPELAKQIQSLLASADIESELDPHHGYDHGTFVPLKVMFPDADIPVVQVSLQRQLNPAFHVQVGAALQVLREQNIFILGSGMSFHNMEILRHGQDIDNHSTLFDNWLTDACTAEPIERNKQLTNWSSAPSAKQSHPREEHLLPLMVIAGSAGKDVGKRIFKDNVMGADVSAYQFG
ncbi:MAG: DODA-type extradiol aromatic ring-opening family dioxygenase [Cycloclasticus sp.]